MNRFLNHMFGRNLTANEHWLPELPVGGSRNAAIFGTVLWLSLAVIASLTLLLSALGDSLPINFRPRQGGDD
jgi:hypothetical protein